jgi:hypothetical protein
MLDNNINTTYLYPTHHIRTYKKLYVFLGVWFIVQILVNFFFGISHFNPLDYSLGILSYLLFPIVFGHFILYLVWENILTHKSDPLWVKFPIQWCVGNIMVAVSAMVMHITKIDFRLCNLAVFVILFALYIKFGKNSTYPNNRPNIIEMWQTLEQKNPNQPTNFIQKIFGKFTNLLPKKNQIELQSKTESKTNTTDQKQPIGYRSELIWIAIFVLINFLFFLWWGFRMEFVSFNTDSLQNTHVANLFKVEKIYNIFAINISPQYTQVDYTTAITPNYAMATYYFDFRDILLVMFWVEITICSIVFVVRYNLFKEFKVPTFANCCITLLSTTITFSGLYMAGTYYNQQVLVYTLPAVLYFIYHKRIFSTFAIFILLFPFHFTMSVFLVYVAGSFFFFWIIEGNNYFKFLQPILHFEKFIMVGVLTFVLILEGMYTFETNYSIVDKLVSALADKPQYVNTIGLYSNIAIIQILLHAIGPLLGGVLIAVPFAWLYTKNQLHRWAYFVITFQLLILSVPFPVAGRTFIFFTLPFVLGMYFVVCRICNNKPFWINIALVICFLSTIVWSLGPRTNDLDITGSYWNNPFLSQSYINFLKDSVDVLKSKNIQYSEYKVISEYFIRQHFESMAYKVDDNGVYEEDRVEKALTYDYLNNYKTDACEHYERKYLLYLLNERSEKWSVIPRTLSKSSTFSVWWSKPTDLVEKNHIQTFMPKTSGQVVVDKLYDDGQRFILVECNIKT